MTPQPDPVRPTPPEVLRELAAQRARGIETQILSRWILTRIIQEPSLDLYSQERQRMPLADVIELMRHDIRIQALPSTDSGLAPIVYSISLFLSGSGQGAGGRSRTRRQV